MARPKNAIQKTPVKIVGKEKTTILLDKALKDEAKRLLAQLGFQTLTPMLEAGLRIQIEKYKAGSNRFG
jgi:hypothetical protein